MSKFIAFSILLLSSNLAFAQNKSEKEPPSISSEYEEAEIQVAADGSYEMVQKVRLKANNDSGRVALSAYSMPMSGNLIEAKLEYAALIQDNKEVEVPVDQVKISNALESSPGISNSKIMTIPFPGVKIGGMIAYKVRIKSKRATLTGGFSYFAHFGLVMLEKLSKTTITSEVPLYHAKSDPEKYITVSTLSNVKPYKYEILLNRPAQIFGGGGRVGTTYHELKRKIPHIHFTSTNDWKSLNAKHRPLYGLSKDELTAPELDKVAQEIKQIKGRMKDADKIAYWIAENVTYSGRWLEPESGWRPRNIKSILSSKVSDCKDFTKLFIALGKKLNIEAEPVYVNIDGTGMSGLTALPIDEANPLPTMDYFNHVVVRYKDGDKWVTFDPVRGLGDASRLPYYLRNSWAVNMFEDKPAYRLAEDPNDYSSVKITNKFSERPDGAIVGTSTIAFQGEISNYLRSVYFGEGERAFREAMASFAPVYYSSGLRAMGEPFVSRAPIVNLTVTYPITVEKDSGEKPRGYLIYPPYYPSKLRQAVRLTAPDFPTDVTQDTTIEGFFARDEIEGECYTKGPMVTLTRRILNSKTDVKIQDRFKYGNTFDPGYGDEKQNLVLGEHRWDLRSCLERTYVRLEKRGASPDQISFEEKIDLKKPQVFDSDFRPRTVWLAQFREAEYRLEVKKDDAELQMNKATAIRTLGSTVGDIESPTYLHEAISSLTKAVELEPKSATYHARKGRYLILLGDTAGAMSAFKVAHALNPIDFNVLMLGGAIFYEKGRHKDAEGYWKTARSYAKDSAQIEAALNSLSKMYCSKMDRCLESLPLHDELVKLFPKHAWAHHKAALAYGKAKNFDKGIELERIAQSLNKFPAGSQTFIWLVKEKVNLLYNSKPRATSEEFEKMEPLLVEAYKMAPDDRDTVWLLTHSYSVLAAATKNDKYMKTARSYFAEMRSKFPHDLDAIRDAEKSLSFYGAIVRAPKESSDKRSPSSQNGLQELRSNMPYFFWKTVSSDPKQRSNGPCIGDTDQITYKHMSKELVSRPKCSRIGDHSISCRSNDDLAEERHYFETEQECNEARKVSQ